MGYLLAIDVGTSACKVSLFDETGNILGMTNRSYAVYYPRQGWAEQDPNEWFEAICAAVKELIGRTKIDAAKIAGIGIDGQSWSAVAVDKNGAVLANTPIWMDTRAGDICGRLNAEIGGEEIFHLCGNPLQPCYTLPKILWYKENMPRIYQKTDKILQSNSFIVYKLTGKITQDLSQCYGYQCFDMRKGCYDAEMCRKMSVDINLLPDIFPCHAVIGTVTKQAAEKTGLAAGTPVVAGGLDAACGALGAGVIQNGQTQEQGGQAGGMSICLDAYKAEESLILSCHVVPGRWLLQGGTVGGGGVMNWLEKELGGEERIVGEKEGKNSFCLLDEKAKQVNPGSDGTVFLPYMAGERSPIWDARAKGVFFGLDFSKTKGHIIRAALEGVAFSLKHNLDVAEKAGAKADILYSVGGAANSALWTQIKCDVTGKKIRVPSSDTATTLGAAVLAGVGVGVYQSFEDAVKKLVKINGEYTPNEENRAVYDRNYQVYLALYESLKDIMNEKR